MGAFSELLRQARLSAGLSQQDLAERSGVSARQISYLESGRTRKPYRRTVRLLADALNLDVPARAELENAARASMRTLAHENSQSKAGAAAEPGSFQDRQRAGTMMPVPAQLPHDVPGFAGRAAELAALTRLREQSTGVLVISAIDGTAGIGKTALAVHWAHRMAGFFPDGQLYINLRGFGPGEPVVPAEAITGFLDALEVPAERTPASLDAQTALYRSLLTGKRMLIVLDNAHDEQQIRPLLPGNRECMVVVTSRRRLAGLMVADGASLVTLEPLTDAESWDLLAGRLDEAKVTAEPLAARALIRCCAGLPLALAVAAAQAATSPGLSLAELAAGLHHEASRLNMLDIGDTTTSMRAAFSWTCRYLSPAAARLFRLLALHPGPDITVPAAAVLASISPDNARELLSQLSRVSLLRQQAPERFAFHDLVRAYSRELADKDSEDEQKAALNGLFDYYLQAAAAAMDIVFPAETGRRPSFASQAVFEMPLSDRKAALAWLDAERANLAAAVRASVHGWPGHTTRLAATLFRYLDTGGHFPDAIAIHGDASRAALRAGDRAAEAVALTNLGVACLRRGKDDEALRYIQQALSLYPQTGDRMGHARALHNLGVVHLRRGQDEEAADYIQQALNLHRAISDRIGQVRSLSALGAIEGRRGRHEQAMVLQEEALAVSRELRDRNGEAYALSYLGELAMRQRRYRPAETYTSRALTLFREIGDRNGEAGALADLGSVDLQQGRRPQAESHFRRALTLYREIGDPNGQAGALNSLGETLLGAGLPAKAFDQYAAALRLASEAGNKHEEVRARVGRDSAHQQSRRQQADRKPS